MASTQTPSEKLLTDGFVVLKAAMHPNAVKEHFIQKFGSFEYESLTRTFDDEDLALGPSRTNFRLSAEDGTLVPDAVAQVLNDVADVWSWYDGSIITALPSSGRQPKHRDYSMPKTAAGVWKIVTFSPVLDVPARGGLTVCVAQTHLGTDSGKTCQVRLKAGDVLVFFSSMLHYGAANSTPYERVLLSQTFEASGKVLQKLF